MEKIEYKLVLMKDKKEVLTVFSESMETLFTIAYDRIIKEMTNTKSFYIDLKHDTVGRTDYWFIMDVDSPVYGMIRRINEWE